MMNAFVLGPTFDITGWLEAGEARCKPVRVDGWVSAMEHVELVWCCGRGP